MTHPVIQIIAASIIESYRKSGAENYLEMKVMDPQTMEEYSLTIQRVAGKTPHQTRREAGERVGDLESLLREVAGTLEGRMVSPALAERLKPYKN